MLDYGWSKKAYITWQMAFKKLFKYIPCFLGNVLFLRLLSHPTRVLTLTSPLCCLAFSSAQGRVTPSLWTWSRRSWKESRNWSCRRAFSRWTSGVSVSFLGKMLVYSYVVNFLEALEGKVFSAATLLLPAMKQLLPPVFEYNHCGQVHVLSQELIHSTS